MWKIHGNNLKLKKFIKNLKFQIFMNVLTKRTHYVKNNIHKISKWNLKLI